MGKVTIPQSPSVTAPFTQGGLLAAGNRRLHLAPEGAIGEKEKSVKNRAALLHGLAFFLLDLLFGVPRGRAAPRPGIARSARAGPLCGMAALVVRRQAAASEQRDFFRFLFWSQKRKVFRKKPSKMSAPPQGGGKRKCKTLKNFQKPLDLKPMFNATLVAETNQVRDICHG